jgi:hypothetical protein
MVVTGMFDFITSCCIIDHDLYTFPNIYSYMNTYTRDFAVCYWFNDITGLLLYV